MRFQATPLAGAYEIELELKGDSRGFFARQFCTQEFAQQGLATAFVQVNTSQSVHQGTLRGLHYQLGEAAETKMVRCLRGAIWDVILDLRPDSPTFGRWHGMELSADNRKMAYIPKGCAHGFLSLTPDTEIFYFVDQFYHPTLERGVRWNDPRFAIAWPAQPTVLSDRDQAHPDFDPDYHLNPLARRA